MKTSRYIARATAAAVVAVGAGCATWSDLDRTEKGTAVGATGGAEPDVVDEEVLTELALGLQPVTLHQTV